MEIIMQNSYIANKSHCVINIAGSDTKPLAGNKHYHIRLHVFPLSLSGRYYPTFVFSKYSFHFADL